MQEIIQQTPISERIKSKKKILQSLQDYKDDLHKYKLNYPYITGNLIRHYYYDVITNFTDSFKESDDVAQMIDDVELSVTAELLQLEALKRDDDAYEGEIARLTSRLNDAKAALEQIRKGR